jgi:hypothetical protein
MCTSSDKGMPSVVFAAVCGLLPLLGRLLLLLLLLLQLCLCCCQLLRHLEH